MSKKSGFLSSSIGKKFIMGLTGFFLIAFLVVHCFINALIFFNDGGLTFNIGAHFMATNWLIRFGEIVLFLGFIIHIVQSLRLTIENKKARPIAYASFNGAANSTWYSRSMGLLGTLILIFLIVHLAHFWVVSRFTGIPTKDANGHEDLYAVMRTVFQQPIVIVLYSPCHGFSCFSLIARFSVGFPDIWP